jgi:hypothetical protein
MAPRSFGHARWILFPLLLALAAGGSLLGLWIAGEGPEYVELEGNDAPPQAEPGLPETTAGPDPAPEAMPARPRVDPELVLRIWTASPDGTHRGAWLLAARKNPLQALYAAREALDREKNWTRIRRIFENLRDLGTEEAVALILEYMVRPDREFDFSHRSETFFEILNSVPDRFAALVEEAALKKIEELVSAGRTSWYALSGYMQLAGRFDRGDGERVLKDLFEGRRADAPQVRSNAYKGLCLTGRVELIEYFLGTPDARKVALCNEASAAELLKLDRERALKALQALLEEPLPGGQLRSCASVLARFAAEENFDIWERDLASPEEGRRLVALRAFSRLRFDATDQSEPLRRRARELILRSAADPDAMVRETALTAIATNDLYKTPEILQALLRLAEGEADPGARGMAEEAILAVKRHIEER